MNLSLSAISKRVAIGVLTLSLTGQVFASGIPTVDAANLIQMGLDAKAQAEQAKAQLDEAMRAVEQAKSQFDETKSLITGNSGYGSRYNDPNMTAYLPTSGGWEQIYSKIDSSTLNNLRTRYGAISSNPVQQKVFDTRLTDLNTAQAALQANNLRLENIKKIQADADSATTPQQKDDIQARIATEQAAIANESNRLAAANVIMAKQEKLDAQKQSSDFSTFLNGK